jgi:hypothetical protein
MKQRWIAACAVAAMMVPGLAACSGSSSGTSAGGTPGTNSPAVSSPGVTGSAGSSASAPGSASPAGQAAAGTGGSGGSGTLTAPGTHLGLGRDATVAWVPPAQATGSGPHQGIKLRVTVESIEKGTIADFQNVNLNATQKKATPYYVKLRITALASTPPPANSDPAITFTAIDDRGQQQQSITFFGTFTRCDDPMPPKSFVSGKTYVSCLAYLMPGGGSIQKVQWDSGPSAANEVTPYFDRPLVWG